jgi:excisionase family DNA binding protein
VALLNVAQTAERLGTTERHIRELIYRRELPYIKVGRLVRVDTDDLDAWLTSQRQPARNGGGHAA